MTVTVKICGLTTPDDVDAALAAGADEIGVVIDPASPRHVPRDAALALARRVIEAGRTAWLVRTVDGDGDWTTSLADALQRSDLDRGAAALGLQLHPRPATRSLTALLAPLSAFPLAVGLPVETAQDLDAAHAHPRAARLVLDAKPPPGAAYAGGHGTAFDWAVLSGWRPTTAWMLAGGLTPETVARAIHATGARAVDVSSGVEQAPGRKDHAAMAAFIANAKAA